MVLTVVELCWFTMLAVNTASGADRKLIVILDSRSPEVVFDPKTRSEGGTNIDDIVRILEQSLGAGVETIRVIVSPTWNEDSAVRDRKPDVVVIHASAFYGRHPAISNYDYGKRLVSFFEAIQTTGAKVLIYSRVEIRPEGVSNLDTKLPRFRGKLETFVLPGNARATFRDAATALSFLERVTAMLAR